MKTVTCDVCRKKVEEPVHRRNYFHLAHRDLCESCNDNLELLIKPKIRTQDPFSYEWYNKLVHDSIDKAMQKGKF